MRRLWEKIKRVVAVGRHSKTKLMQRLWIKRGVSLDKNGRTQEAIACYDTALRIDPLDPMAWNFKGGVLLKLCRYLEAREAFRTFIELAPPEYAKYVSETKEIMREIDVIIKKEKNITRNSKRQAFSKTIY